MQNLPTRFTPVTRGSFESSLILSDSPMYSSSAYPASIAPSEVVTTDRRAIDAPIETRRQDATDGISIGLIPQLIHVLHILTEGQELLSRKIQEAKLDEASRSFSAVAHLNRFQIPTRQPVVGSDTTPFEPPSTPTTKHSESDGETTPANTFGIAWPADLSTEVHSGAPSSPSDPDSAPASDSQAIVNATAPSEPMSVPKVDSVQKESAAPAGTTESPLHRDYNFFDELDARLASLQDPPG
jgi:hypothetical protein